MQYFALAMHIVQWTHVSTIFPPQDLHLRELIELVAFPRQVIQAFMTLGILGNSEAETLISMASPVQLAEMQCAYMGLSTMLHLLHTLIVLFNLT